MNEKANPEHTKDDQAVLKGRYYRARNTAISLFASFFVCFLVIVGTFLKILLGSFDPVPKFLFGLAFGVGLVAIISGWVGVFFAIRALILRGKLHFGTTDNLSDAILAAVVNNIAKNIPAGLIKKTDSQEPRRDE